jgi:hypothetical protein
MSFTDVSRRTMTTSAVIRSRTFIFAFSHSSFDDSYRGKDVLIVGWHLGRQFNQEVRTNVKRGLASKHVLVCKLLKRQGPQFL